MATLGGLASPFDPHRFGFLTVSASPPFAKPYAAQWVVDAHSAALPCDQIDYYMSEDFSDRADHPFVEINFRHCAHFVVRKLILDSAIDHVLAIRPPNVRVPPLKNRWMPPKSIVVELTSDGESTSAEMAVNDGLIDAAVEAQPCTSVRFTMAGESLTGGRILRVRRIEILGNFLPK
jgi:hypothetical protein